MTKAAVFTTEILMVSLSIAKDQESNTTRAPKTNANRSALSILLVAFAAAVITATGVIAAELPPELPLWDEQVPRHAFPPDGEERMRSANARPGSPSGSNRVFSVVSSPTYSIHRPKKPNSVGLVICPGGGFRDVWIDREGHDLAILLKEHGVTSLVLKYRTRSEEEIRKPNGWKNSNLLEAGVDAELHVYGRGGHGFDLGVGRGESTAMWPVGFVAWLRDFNIIED